MSSIGVSLPITRDPSDGFSMLKGFKETIKQNFKMLLLTSPGERVMEPEFGVGMRRFLFENYDDTMPHRIESIIREQVSLYIPVIKIVEIDFDTREMDRNIMGLTIVYDIPSIASSEMLEITI